MSAEPPPRKRLEVHVDGEALAWFGATDVYNAAMHAIAVAGDPSAGAPVDLVLVDPAYPDYPLTRLEPRS